MDFGRFAEAQRELAVTVGLEESPMALLTLGQVLMYQGKDQEAIPYLSRRSKPFTRAVVLDVPRNRLSAVLGRKAEADDADRHGLVVAEKGDGPRPSQREGARFNLAHRCAQLGDRSRAESEIAQALQLSSNDADTRWMAALTYEALWPARQHSGRLERRVPCGRTRRCQPLPDVADLRKMPVFNKNPGFTSTRNKEKRTMAKNAAKKKNGKPEKGGGRNQGHPSRWEGEEGKKVAGK